MFTVQASIRLRGVIGSTLSNTSQDLREQADRVQQSLTDRVAETEEATRKLETNLKKTVDEIASVETTIRALKDAIWEKDAPNKVRNGVLCTRLHCGAGGPDPADQQAPATKHRVVQGRARPQTCRGGEHHHCSVLYCTALQR